MCFVVSDSDYWEILLGIFYLDSYKYSTQLLGDKQNFGPYADVVMLQIKTYSKWKWSQ